jgi:hypothetical protein
MINSDSDYPHFNTQCSGFQQCQINVKKVPVGTYCPEATHTDYLTVIYDCVPGESELKTSRLYPFHRKL